MYISSDSLLLYEFIHTVIRTIDGLLDNRHMNSGLSHRNETCVGFCKSLSSMQLMLTFHRLNSVNWIDGTVSYVHAWRDQHLFSICI